MYTVIAGWLWQAGRGWSGHRLGVSWGRPGWGHLGSMAGAVVDVAWVGGVPGHTRLSWVTLAEWLKLEWAYARGILQQPRQVG